MIKMVKHITHHYYHYTSLHIIIKSWESSLTKPHGHFSSPFEDPPFSHNPINGVPTCGIWLTPFSADSCHSSWCLRNPVEVVLSFQFWWIPHNQETEQQRFTSSSFGLLKSPPNKKTHLLLEKKTTPPRPHKKKGRNGTIHLIPSRELTYPHPPKMAFWRWFSFSQGGIC